MGIYKELKKNLLIKDLIKDLNFKIIKENNTILLKNNSVVIYPETMSLWRNNKFIIRITTIDEVKECLL